jgi:hypothetical protein
MADGCLLILQARERGRDGPCNGSIDHDHGANRFLSEWFAVGSRGGIAEAQGDIVVKEPRCMLKQALWKKRD